MAQKRSSDARGDETRLERYIREFNEAIEKCEHVRAVNEAASYHGKTLREDECSSCEELRERFPSEPALACELRKSDSPSLLLYIADRIDGVRLPGRGRRPTKPPTKARHALACELRDLVFYAQPISASLRQHVVDMLDGRNAGGAPPKSAGHAPTREADLLARVGVAAAPHLPSGRLPSEKEKNEATKLACAEVASQRDAGGKRFGNGNADTVGRAHRHAKAKAEEKRSGEAISEEKDDDTKRDAVLRAAWASTLRNPASRIKTP